MTTDFAKKTSIKVANQLPEFIRSETDYQTFVSFIQAYVFVMLSMVYVSLATAHHDHGDGHAHH